MMIFSMIINCLASSVFRSLEPLAKVMISALDILPRTLCKGNVELSGGVVFFIVVFQLILNLLLGLIVLLSHYVIESETRKNPFLMSSKLNLMRFHITV